jgi:hypothetical protein
MVWRFFGFDRNPKIWEKFMSVRNGLLTKKNAPTRFQGFLQIVKS